MSCDREATNEHLLSVHLVAGDDEVYLSGHEPMVEDSAGSPKRESLVFSPEEEGGEGEE